MFKVNKQLESNNLLWKIVNLKAVQNIFLLYLININYTYLIIFLTKKIFILFYKQV